MVTDVTRLNTAMVMKKPTVSSGSGIFINRVLGGKIEKIITKTYTVTKIKNPNGGGKQYFFSSKVNFVSGVTHYTPKKQ